MRRRDVVFEVVTTVSYNEHGDKSEECMAATSNIADPNLLAFSIGEDGRIIPDRREGDPPPDLEGTTRIISEYRYAKPQLPRAFACFGETNELL